MALPLDVISASAAAAYSTRKLRAAYAGSAIKVRRVSDDAVQDIGFVANDFDATAFTTFIGGSSGAANIFYDQARANNATQGTSASQATVATTLSRYGIGTTNASAIVSPAPDDTSIQNIFGSGGFATVVVDNLGTGNTNALISKGSWVLYLFPGGGDYQIWFYQKGSIGDGFWGTNDVVTSNSKHVITVAFNAATPSVAPVITLDGKICTFGTVNGTSGTAVSDATLPLEILNETVLSSNANSLGGTIYEALFFKGIPSAADQAALVADVQTFYQIGHILTNAVDLGHNQSAATPANLTITLLNQVNPGDLMVLEHYANSTLSPISSITDSGGNTTWALAAPNLVNAPFAEIYFCRSAVLIPAGGTITANWPASALRHAVSAFSMPVAGPVSVSTVTNSSTGTATSSGLLTFPTEAQVHVIEVLMMGTGAVPGAITWGGDFVGVGGNTATGFAMPATRITISTTGNTATPAWVNSVSYKTVGVSFQIGAAPSGAVSAAPSGVGRNKAKNKGKRVWRVMLPSGKIVVCDSPTEYYNLLTRAVNEPDAPVNLVKPVKRDKLAETLEPERPQPKQPLLKLRPAEKREAMNWAAAEDMAVNLRALADSIRAARTPIADNDDDEAAELLRWVI